MADYTSVEIDEVNDFNIAESIMKKIHLKITILFLQMVSIRGKN